VRLGTLDPSTVPQEHVTISPPSHFDQGVVIGYRPERKGVTLDLRIGKGARVRSGTIIYAGSVIGDRLQTGHNVLIREENRIADDVSFWSNTVIDYGCIIGNRVKIHCNVYIPQFTVLEEDVFIAPGCTFANDVHPGCDRSKECMRGPILKKGAVLGVNVTVVPMVTIGEYSLIGSGSVVTKDIPPYSVAVGNPSRILRRTRDLKCKTGLREFPYPHP
jgi:acetyltransferase-like isoleucine patch superfamily enzyme